jgi:lactoylglutathione lyase
VTTERRGLSYAHTAGLPA